MKNVIKKERIIKNGQPYEIIAIFKVDEFIVQVFDEKTGELVEPVEKNLFRVKDERILDKICQDDRYKKATVEEIKAIRKDLYEEAKEEFLEKLFITAKAFLDSQCNDSYEKVEDS